MLTCYFEYNGLIRCSNKRVNFKHYNLTGKWDRVTCPKCLKTSVPRNSFICYITSSKINKKWSEFKDSYDWERLCKLGYMIKRFADGRNRDNNKYIFTMQKEYVTCPKCLRLMKGVEINFL